MRTYPIRRRVPATVRAQQRCARRSGRRSTRISRPGLATSTSISGSCRWRPSGGYDRVVLGQDDAGPVGLHFKDVAALRRTIARFGLAGRAAIEPGADELGMVLLARVFARNVGWTPTVAVHYSRPDGGAVVDKLEYVPIDTTIGRIIAACGAARVHRGTSPPDIELYVRVARHQSLRRSRV